MTENWRAVGERCRNWGKWGSEDQLGTLNYITPAHVARAAALAKTGKTFALGVNIDAYGPQGAHGFRRNPIHLMTVDGGDEHFAKNNGDWGGETEHGLCVGHSSGPMRFNDDYIMMPTQCVTQWDALSHVYYDGQLYNGYPATAVTSFGATRDGIDPVALSGNITGRGVLLDVARHRGVDMLPANSGISPEELDEIAARQGVEVGEGDIVVVRTGWWQDFLARRDGEAWLNDSPGLSWRCAEWLHNKKAAAVACDNIAVEVLPGEIEGGYLAFHMITLRDMGLMLGEIWNLEALGRDCAEDGVYEFLLVAPALPITGGTGTPLNPIAIK
jgi:kynurenine formamidase